MAGEIVVVHPFGFQLQAFPAHDHMPRQARDAFAGQPGLIRLDVNAIVGRRGDGRNGRVAPGGTQGKGIGAGHRCAEQQDEERQETGRTGHGARRIPRWNVP